MNELTANEIVKQVAAIKDWMRGLDESGLVYYQIFAFNPALSDAYQAYYKGDNKKEKIIEKFEREFDTLLNNSSIVKVKITAKNSRTSLGVMEMLIKPAYGSNMYPAPRPEIQPEVKPKDLFSKEQPQQAQPQSQPNSLLGIENIGGLFGLAFDETENLGKYGFLGNVLQLRDQTIERKYQDIERNQRLEKYIEENAVLKQQVRERENEILNLKNRVERLEKKVNELDDEICEYERLNPQRNLISGISSEVLSGAFLGLVKKSPKISSLLGLDEEAANNVQQPQTQAQMPDIEVEEITEVNEE